MTTDLSTDWVAVHAGHSRIKVGVFRSTSKDAVPQCLHHGQYPKGSPISQQQRLELTNWLNTTERVKCVVSGSHWGAVAGFLDDFPVTVAETVEIRSFDQLPLRVDVDVPHKVGMDRLLNAVAVRSIGSITEPAIIVDSGTAVTVDVVYAEGNFVGGAILPGVLMGASALHGFTSTLPLIDGREFLTRSPVAIGRNTEAAMASGLYWGHLGAVRELINRAQQELSAPAQIYLTGGAMPLLTPEFPEATAVAHLTLLGSVLSASFNQ